MKYWPSPGPTLRFRTGHQDQGIWRLFSKGNTDENTKDYEVLEWLK